MSSHRRRTTPRRGHPHIYFARGVWHVRAWTPVWKRVGAWVRWPTMQDAFAFAAKFHTEP